MVQHILHVPIDEAAPARIGPVGMRSKLGIPVSSQATALPLMMHDRERSRAKDTTITGKRFVRYGCRGGLDW